MAAPRPSGLHGFRVHSAQSPAASAFQFDLAGIYTDRKSALKPKENQKRSYPSSIRIIFFTYTLFTSQPENPWG
jgi:hypothetical protein